MDIKQHTPRCGQQSDERFVAVLEELTKIKDAHVVRTLNWYKRYARRPMVFFRASGVLIIILSVSVPFLGVLEGFWKDTVLPIVTLMIAGLTGLSSFFQWQSAWRGYRQTQFTLEHLLSIWELRIVEAKHHPDTQEGIEIALQVTKQLLDDARAATAAETEEYFELVQLPRIE
ncbi:MAG: DUF4231 domain-containing protein [Anaerolineae bacterium]